MEKCRENYNESKDMKGEGMNYFLDEPDNNSIEIDLSELFFVIRRKLWLLILCGIIMGAGFFAFTKYMITPKYTSSSSFLVLTKETTLASLSDLQMGTQLTKDYRELTLSRPVLQEVVDNLNLDFNYKDLQEMISIDNPDSTRILVMSVEDIDPKRACAIVDELAEVASAYIGDKMEVIPPKIIETGEVNEEPTSPNILKNTVIGAFLGIFLCAVVVVLFAILDDTIKSEEDIEKYLHVSTLASVPDRKDYITGKPGRKKKAKKKKLKKQASSARRGGRK